MVDFSPIMTTTIVRKIPTWFYLATWTAKIISKGVDGDSSVKPYQIPNIKIFNPLTMQYGKGGLSFNLCIICFLPIKNHCIWDCSVLHLFVQSWKMTTKMLENTVLKGLQNSKWFSTIKYLSVVPPHYLGILWAQDQLLQARWVHISAL